MIVCGVVEEREREERGRCRKSITKAIIENETTIIIAVITMKKEGREGGREGEMKLWYLFDFEYLVRESLSYDTVCS